MSRANRAVFRMPAASAAIPLVAVLCVTPLATVGGGWWALYAIPVIAAVYIVVTRTTADESQLTAHKLLGAKRMTWSEMDGLVLRDARWTVAVGKDGRRLPLPMVRPRDLPRLAAASGGSLNLDPAASDAEEDSAAGAVDTAADSAGAGAAAGAGQDGSAAGPTDGEVGAQDAPANPGAAPDGAAVATGRQGAGRATSAG